MYRQFFLFVFILLLLAGGPACRSDLFPPAGPQSVAPTSLRNVPALRLNYRFEPDVPAPAAAVEAAPVEMRNEAVQADFDQNRPQEILDKTVPSPDGERVVAVYHRAGDLATEFRLDMYTADGRRLGTITHPGMASHFPGTIRWSPDSANVAFVAMVRLGNAASSPEAAEDDPGNEEPEEEKEPAAAEDANTAANTNTETESNAAADNTNREASAANTEAGEAPPVLTFRTEQIYLADASGADVKPLTQNEGLIYFYFAWAPDSSALAALAARQVEWKVWEYRAEQSGQVFKPAGRPRIVEKNGRERLLDDNLTVVHPVWSPDSSKIAAAFDKQIRIYDAIGDAPTQAAIPLRNQLLIASKKYDETKKEELGVEANANASANDGNRANSPPPAAANKPDANANAANANTADLPPGVLPDAANVVSFNPIVNLLWPEDATLYFETAYIREFIESANNVRSYSRWHRLLLSPQAVVLGNQNAR